MKTYLAGFPRIDLFGLGRWMGLRGGWLSRCQLRDGKSCAHTKV